MRLRGCVVVILILWGSHGASASPAALRADIADVYDRWSELLKWYVLEVPPPDRVAAPLQLANFSLFNRVKIGSSRPTRFEANRLRYHLLDENSPKFFALLKADMAMIADHPAFDSLTEKEQLAFWLNARTVAVVDFVRERYIIRKPGNVRDKVQSTPVLEGARGPISVAEVEERLLDMAADPLLLYGFYDGSIGGPSIQARPYAADTLYDLLAAGAKEFTTSLRGARRWQGSIHVSIFYARHAARFGWTDDPEKLLDHMRGHADQLAQDDLRPGVPIVFKMDDPWVADIKGGVFGVTSGIDPLIGVPNGHRQTNELMRALAIRALWHYRRGTQQGEVDIYEIDAAPKPEEQNPTEQNSDDQSRDAPKEDPGGGSGRS